MAVLCYNSAGCYGSTTSSRWEACDACDRLDTPVDADGSGTGACKGGSGEGTKRFGEAHQHGENALLDSGGLLDRRCSESEVGELGRKESKHGKLAVAEDGSLHDEGLLKVRSLKM